MADLTYSQMQTLLGELARNLDNSERGKSNSAKLDRVIESLNTVSSNIEKNTEAVAKYQGIDYDKLSAAIVAGINKANGGSGTSSGTSTNSNSNSSSSFTQKQNNTAPSAPVPNRRPGSLLQQMQNNFTEHSNSAKSASSSTKKLGKSLEGASSAASRMSKAFESFEIIQKFTNLVKTGVGMLEDRADVYRNMSRNGELFTGDVLAMSRTIHSSGMSLDTFSKAIASSSQGLKLLGPDSFARVSSGLQTANIRFGNLGLTVDEQNTQLSSYTERLRISGGLQSQTTETLVSGFRDVIQTSTSLASAVGVSRDAILKAAEAITAKVENRALLQMDSGTGGQNITNFASQVSAAYGGGEVGNRIANAIISASHGIWGKETSEVAQQLGPGFQTLVNNASSALHSQTTLSGEQLTKMAATGIEQTKQTANERSRLGYVAAAQSGDSTARHSLETWVAASSAQIDVNKASAADTAQKKQTSATQGALSLAQSRQQIEAVKQATATAALTQVQNTLGESLKTYNTAVNDGTHAFVQHINGIEGNSIDQKLGGFISALTNAQGAIATVAEAFVGLSFLKSGMLARSLGGLIRNVSKVAKGLKGAGKVAEVAEEVSATVGKSGLVGRSGLLRTIGQMGARGAITEGVSTAAGVLGTTAAGVVGTGLSAVAGIAYGAYRNHNSTKEYEAGHISEKKNDINHAENYGIMAGAATGALAGAAIGSVVPVIGTAIGGVIGGAIGGFAGYETGGAVGNHIYKNKSDVVRNPVHPEGQGQGGEENPQDANAQDTERRDPLSDALQNLTLQVAQLKQSIERNNTYSLAHLQSIDRNTGDAYRQLKKTSGIV